MPSRNIVKEFDLDSYYHVYSRGANKMPIFITDADYTVFLSLFKRYLSEKQGLSPSRVKYPKYKNRVKLLAYCLMPNHIHLLIHQSDERAISEFMRSVLTSYSMYFNKTHRHIGPVFQSRYKAVKIDSQSYLDHISRYIHLNPKAWKDYRYSSLLHYRSSRPPEWLEAKEILAIFNNDISEYLKFLHDYTDTKDQLDELKWQLANN